MTDAEKAYEAAQAAIAKAMKAGSTSLKFDERSFRALETLPPEVRGLTGLRFFNLTNTQVSDLGPLSEILGLREVTLSNTPVSDLGPLSRMGELSLLYLTKTNVLDLRPLLTPLAAAKTKDFDLRIAGIPATQDPAIARIAGIEVPVDRAIALYDLLRDGWAPPTRTAADFLFLSYASPNRPQIADLHRFLSGQSLPLWWDQDIPAGDGWRATIKERLTTAKAVVTFWTAESVVSKAVIEEAARAQAAGRLVHVRLDGADLPYGFGETQYIDLRGWDGAATHPQMAKLLVALRDRLAPPGAAAMATRLTAAAPLAMVPKDGRLSPVDTPLHTPPAVDNGPDLDARIAGLRQSLAALRAKAADRVNYQFPNDLGHALTAVHGALHGQTLSWYGIDDARASLCDCMDEHDAKGSWNAVTYKDLVRLVTGLAALQPLLQPRQVPMGQPGAKPPEPDPVVRQADFATVTGIADQVAAIAALPEAAAVLNPDAVDLLQRDVALIRDSAGIDPDKKAPRLRRAVRGLAYATGAIMAAVGTETIATLLTAPGAATALVQRLQPLFDALLKFFL